MNVLMTRHKHLLPAGVRRQVLLANLPDWVAKNYFTPEWRTLSLNKATQMIYRKAGQVT